MDIKNIFRENSPAFQKRGVHLDLKGLPPTPERMVELFKLFAEMRYNVVLVEWEDTFPWTVDERFRSPTVYSREDIALFAQTAESLKLELIPLVTSLGHMETPLSVPGYEHLREIPDFEAGLNPLAPGARDLIQSMVDDVLKLLPNVKRFHLGGDEARTFGKNPETKAYIEKHGKGALYLHHIEPILENLNARGVRPILWHDMMIDWDSDALRSLAEKSDLMVWAYGGDPADGGEQCNTDMVKRFSEHGITLWGATAYKGAEGYDSDLPDLPLHTENVQGWVNLAEQVEFTGVVATAWSRYAVDTVQCNPIDSSLDSMLNVAIIMHDGKAPESGEEFLINALESLGEKERFEACRSVMAKLAELRKTGWEKVQHARQVMVLGKMDPRRTSAMNPKLGLHALVSLKEIVGKADTVAEDMRTAFAGLMEPVWIEEYLATRIEPLRQELSSLEREKEKASS